MLPTLLQGCLLVSSVLAHSTHHQQAVLQHNDDALKLPLPRPRVAIVGGGAGGTSAAFFLNFLAKQDPSLAVDIDLFDSNDYLGGRSTVVYPFDDETHAPVELGASIFVKANENLYKAATNEFRLRLQDGHGGGASSEEDEGGMSIWNGEQFVYHESTSTWWNIAKMAWRYGWASPLKTRDAVASTVDSFVKLYGSGFQSQGPYDTIADFAHGLKLDSHAFKTTLQHLRNQGVNDLFVQELVGAATRVNYGQNPGKIHAFEGMVSMAASGASSVVGGNRQIFEGFAGKSNARVRLSTTVERIVRLPDIGGGKQWRVHYRNNNSGIRTVAEYDSIIYATPMHSQAVSFAPKVRWENTDIPDRIPPLEYVQLHVTILVTNASRPRPDFFNGATEVPKTILSTFEPYEAGKVKTRPKLNSLNYLRNLGNLSETSGEGHVIKIFSEYELLDTHLNEIFGENEVFWVTRKQWAAYPVAAPFGQDERLPAFKPDNGSSLYYVNAFERWVSTMETETVSAWNVVSLLVRDLFGYQVKKSWAQWDGSSAD